MKYENAKDILPPYLVKELQAYAAGQLIYVPSIDEKKNWGEASGLREQLKKRNIMIRNKYAHGITITELANEYYLSLDSIKKIIYATKDKGKLVFRCTAESAVSYADAGMLEEWMQLYELDRSVTYHKFSVYGVVKLPLRLVHSNIQDKDNLSNPLKYTIGKEEREISPLIVIYEQEKLWCSKEQIDYFTELKQNKVNSYPSIIIISNQSDEKTFRANYGKVLFFIKSIKI